VHISSTWSELAKRFFNELTHFGSTGSKSDLSEAVFQLHSATKLLNTATMVFTRIKTDEISEC